MKKSKKIKQLKRENKLLRQTVARLSDDTIREEPHSWAESPLISELDAELQDLAEKEREAGNV